MNDCNILYIDKSRLHENKPGEWYLINRDRLCEPHPEGHYAVDMDSFNISGTDRYSPDLIDWLIENEDAINYKMSEDFIKSKHIITATYSQNIVRGLQTLDEMSVNEFISKINNIHTTGLQNNFDTIKYKYHVSLYDKGQQVGIRLIRFREDANCFSFPLLRIIAAESVGSSLLFKIQKGHEAAPDTIHLVIKKGSVYVGYYNFSHIPPFTVI